jgi:predicted metalloprotease with PDZ domain
LDKDTPIQLWSPTFNRATDPSLLWVYEGQTEFWGRILAARAQLRTPQQTLDKLALDTALVANRTGREWKTLADSTLDVLYMPHQQVAWRDWQRREDYYPEGVLLWLDVDAHLREPTHARVGMDDFARVFFAMHGHVETTTTYTFSDVCDALNSLAPADWSGFLNQHLLSHDSEIAIRGLARAGWRLTYDTHATETFLQDETDSGWINLDTSLRLTKATIPNVDIFVRDQVLVVQLLRRSGEVIGGQVVFALVQMLDPPSGRQHIAQRNDGIIVTKWWSAKHLGCLHD